MFITLISIHYNLLLELVLILFAFIVHRLPLDLSARHVTPVHVFACARQLAFILRAHLVVFLTTPKPVCPDLKVWSKENYFVVNLDFLEERAALQ